MVDVRAARKEAMPYLAQLPQEWASNIVENQHEEALYAMGELCIFTLMWRPVDFEAGLVEHCSTCFGDGTAPLTARDRAASAFDQPTQRKCPDCYGTTFEGGYRAQILRPTLMADRDQTTEDASRGVVTRDTIRFETSSDFTFYSGDYIFRADGTRFQTEDRNEIAIRPGFTPPLSSDSMTGVSTAFMEEETAVAFIIPPTVEQQKILLDVSGSFVVDNLAVLDTIRTNGYLFDGEPPKAPHQGPTGGQLLIGHGPPPEDLAIPPGSEYFDLDSGDFYGSDPSTPPLHSQIGDQLAFGHGAPTSDLVLPEGTDYLDLDTGDIYEGQS